MKISNAPEEKSRWWSWGGWGGGWRGRLARAPRGRGGGGGGGGGSGVELDARLDVVTGCRARWPRTRRGVQPVPNLAGALRAQAGCPPSRGTGFAHPSFPVARAPSGTWRLVDMRYAICASSARPAVTRGTTPLSHPCASGARPHRPPLSRWRRPGGEPPSSLHAAGSLSRLVPSRPPPQVLRYHRPAGPPSCAPVLAIARPPFRCDGAPGRLPLPPIRQRPRPAPSPSAVPVSPPSRCGRAHEPL